MLPQSRTISSKASEIDIYEYDKQLGWIYNLLKKEISAENFNLVQKYDTYMVKDGLAKGTRLKHLKMLLSLDRLLKKDWSDVSDDDIDILIRRIMDNYGNTKGKETETSRDHKKVLKIFFRWHKLGSRSFREVGDPVQTKGIRINRPEEKITREDLVTPDEESRLLHACGENARDRAFIHMALDAASRSGELLTLQIKHVKYDKYGYVIHVDGKTGARPIRLIRSTPSIAAWLAVHPFKNNPDSPFWLDLGRKNYGKHMTYPAARAVLQRRCRKAELSKRIYITLCRHTGATDSAHFLNEVQMRKRHGWSKRSDMPAKYVHLVNADVDNAILTHYGIKEDEDNTSTRVPKICSICEMPNTADSTKCSKCGKALDLQTALEQEELEKEKTKMIEDKLTKFGNIKDELESLKQELKKELLNELKDLKPMPKEN